MWNPSAGVGSPVLEAQLAALGKQIKEINLRLAAITALVRQTNEEFYETFKQHEGNEPR